MAQMPMPSPPLDGVPPSPPGVSAGGGPNPQVSQLAPPLDLSGSMQVVQLSLQAATQAAKLIDLIGQINPQFAPTGQLIIEQLRGGLKSSLQQGSTGLESGMQPNVPSMAMPQQAPIEGPMQQPPPPMPSGF